MDHVELDSMIDRLDTKVLESQGLFNFGGFDWDPVFELMNEIQAGFKGTRYPSALEHDEAWRKFCNLRNDAFRLKREQFGEGSQRCYDEIDGYLRDVWHSETMDSIIDVMTANLMRTTVDGMKWKGQQLKEARRLFHQYKLRMKREHKADIYERIGDCQERLDAWWGQYKAAREERQRAWEERQQARIERAEKKAAIKARIEQNLENNRDKLRAAREKLSNAEDALERYKQRRDDLQDKIDDSHSDNWIDKAEGWLQEFEDKISDIEDSIRDKEEYIDRLESWIEEDRNKLNSWRD
ncbi:MAG: hypothetical protein UZ17_ACD001001001 [Acidobacteria bacterium OLB17]|nr:MAG: hypothetical protein UZ17_ACD001001001 [Acidobacteria bacterium OLB17]